MKITFLGQGLESESKKSVGNQLLSLFQEKKYNTFTGISAFASQAGIFGLSECIAIGKDHLSTINIIVGIDQEGTSKEALDEINSLNVNSYIFYQKESPIFHSKIYLFEGGNDTALIVGSSNLTARGLFGNVESSLLVEFPNIDEEGIKLLGELKDYYGSVLNFTDKNLFKINTKNIQLFIAEGIVPTRMVWKNKDQKHTSDAEKDIDNKIDVPKRGTVKIPSIFKGKYKTEKDVKSIIEELEIKENSDVDTKNHTLVWGCENLSERDLNIPTGPNTNATGSIYFKKGILANIDQRHHFKDVVFAGLEWGNSTRKNKTYLQIAKANIRFLILGIDYGIYNQTLTHNPLTNTKTYKQKNCTTNMSWGKVKSLIAQRELIGKSAFLYINTSVSDEYIFEIK